MEISKYLSNLFISVLLFILPSCSHNSLTEIYGKYAIRLSNPVITIDSSGTKWISNADKTYNYLLSMDRKDIMNISECTDSNVDTSTYLVRKPYRNKKYMVHISYDLSSFPYTHTHIVYENYLSRYIVELYKPYNIRSLYGDIVSCKNLLPLRLALSELFTPARRNKLPQKIITSINMKEVPYFVRTDKDKRQIMIPYSLLVSSNENIDDIVFPPIHLQDSLFLTNRIDKKSFDYPVYMNDSINMGKEYYLELTREDKTYEYKGLLKKRNRLLSPHKN